MEMRKGLMVRMPNRDVEGEVRRMNPDSSAVIYVTTSLGYQCRLIVQNRKMKYEKKIKNKGKCSGKGRPYESVR